MITLSTKVWLTLAASLLLHALAGAQTLYRCGSTYQDQPCSGTQPTGSVVGGSGRPDSGAASTAPAASGTVSQTAADSRCHQSGLDAEKIRWAKEGGRTLQQALDANSANAAFIQDTYGRRGTAAEVRLAVEQDCIAEQQRALEAARLNAAAAAIAAGGASSKSTPASSSGAASSADGGAARH